VHKAVKSCGELLGFDLKQVSLMMMNSRSNCSGHMLLIYVTVMVWWLKEIQVTLTAVNILNEKFQEMCLPVQM